MSPAQHRAWVAYMRVQLRMNYEINSQLQRDSGLSLADYHVMNALSNAPDHKMQVTDAFRQVIWPRGRHEFWPHPVQLARLSLVVVLLVRSR